MLVWDYFACFALLSLILWTFGAVMAFRRLTGLMFCFTAAGILVFASFIIWLWSAIDRPPLLTMGETRLWYAFLLPVVGLVVYHNDSRHRWLPAFCTLLSAVFVGINLLRPEIHEKMLVPALQSPWFVPHVVVYMFSYAMFGAAAIMAVWLLCADKSELVGEMALCDKLVDAGLSFMLLGMITGALWAKAAWGHYWTWDPKETWAAVTWFSGLVYVHLRLAFPRRWRTALAVLLLTFAFLQMCWWGLSYLPAAQGNSLHVY